MSRLSDVFRDIYRNNRWASIETRSGGGSEIGRTSGIRKRLPELLKHFGVRTMVDAGCGDWNWMARIKLPGILTSGYDIVPEVIAENQRNYADRAMFCVGDITEDILPKVDLILCRTVLFHLSLANIHKALGKFMQSGSRYLLLTSHPREDLNADVADGGWRRLNFQIAPFFFPEPLVFIVEEDSILGLWSMASIRREE